MDENNKNNVINENVKKIITDTTIASIFNPDDKKIMIKMFYMHRNELNISKDDLKIFASIPYNKMISDLVFEQIKIQMSDDVDFVNKFIGVDIEKITKDERELIKQLSFIPDKIKESL